MTSGCVLPWWKREGAFRGLFHKNTNTIHEGSTLKTQAPPKEAPPPNSITLGIRISHMSLAIRVFTYEFGGGHKHSNHISDEVGFDIDICTNYEADIYIYLYIFINIYIYVHERLFQE